VPPAQELPAKHPRGRLRQRRSRPGPRVFSWAGWACIWALGAGCRDFARPALFPEGAAGEPVVQEQALLGLAPEGDAAVAQLLAAEGAPPRLDQLPQGCAFAPRCAFADALCRGKSPPYAEKQPGHWAACWHSDRLAGNLAEAAHG